MRKLIKREKVLLAIVGSIGLIVLALRILPAALQGLAGGTIAEKRERLQTAENLVQLDKHANRIDESLRGQVGLQGRLISDSLFAEISQLHSVQAFNQVRQVSDLIALHPALEAKAATLFAYKTRRGGLAKLEELKTIQGSIFEGEQPRVVISQRISQLARKSGLKPDYQLNIKPPPGKKTEKIPRQAKQNFVLYSYMKQLEDELKLLNEQEKLAQKQVDTESELERAMFDGWWGNVDTPGTASESSQDGDVRETRPEEEGKEEPKPSRSSTQGAAGTNSSFDGGYSSATSIAEHTDLPVSQDRLVTEKSPFAPLPAIIPIALRVQLIGFIHSFIKLELYGATEFKRGFLAEQIAQFIETVPRGFAGFGPKAPVVQVRLREDSILLAKFEDLIGRYEAAQTNDSDKSTDGILDYEVQIMALTEYVDSIEQQIKRLQNSLASVALAHEPEIYGIEIKFKSDIGTVVRLIESIETSTKWLYVKNLKIINDKMGKNEDKEKRRLSVELSMIAKAL